MDLLSEVLIRHRPADEAFEQAAEAARLDPRDRAFALNLVATTLRRLGQIDAVIRRFLDRPLSARGAEAQNLLRLAVCQLAFLQTPAHAAVHTAVALAGQRRSLRPYGGLVNAVLRRAAAQAEAIVGAQDAAFLNTPRWLWSSWEAAYGKTETRAIAEAHLSEAPLDLTLKDPDRPPVDLVGAQLPTGSLRLRHHKGPVASLPGYATGDWWVQDAAAALPARLFGPLAGLRVIDLCAAPGGKTAQLAAAGAKVVAVERSSERLRQLRGNLERLKLEAELLCADAAEWQPADPADAVLLDAPCSATGTIRRHPDVARLKRPGDVATLAALQARLLAAAEAMTRPGGTLIYCACSLQPEEGPAQVEAVLAGGGLARIPVEADEVGGLAEAITADGDVRTLPCHLAPLGGMDGFYIARLRKLRA
ncbi:MAG: methyltransferase domain-containing protein [Rhodospirillales bacterium]|nr:methyltransferase domain-containing protein [Rhodospirillales bacterium]